MKIKSSVNIFFMEYDFLNDNKNDKNNEIEIINVKKGT